LKTHLLPMLRRPGGSVVSCQVPCSCSDCSSSSIAACHFAARGEAMAAAYESGSFGISPLGVVGVVERAVVAVMAVSGSRSPASSMMFPSRSGSGRNGVAWGSLEVVGLTVSGRRVKIEGWSIGCGPCARFEGVEVLVQSRGP
jgi:hypothetical protein